MTLRTYKNKEGNEKSAPRLACNNQIHCDSGSCTYDEMIDRVRAVLEQCIEDFEVRIQNDEGDSTKLHAKLIKNLEKKMKELEAKELAQWESQSHPDESQRMPAHIFKQLNEKLLQEKEEVRQALCKAYESMPEPMDYKERLLRFQDALDALNDPDADAQAKNNLLKACIERIEYSRERPQRSNRKREKRGMTWTNPPIELDVKLKV